ncbi:putative L-type lectin-domain containing receptor kinase S.5 [Wolffia australiana]
MMARIFKGSSAAILLYILLPLPFLMYPTDATNGTHVETFPFGSPFNSSPETKLKFRGDAQIDKDALQITRDTMNEESYLLNNSGRVIYDKPFKIWEGSTNQSNRKVISFNSFFEFNIYPVSNKTPGEGLAFIIVPSSETIPENSYGQYLGLTNSSTDGDPANKFIAVEFDTLQQSFDPDDNHVGLNINGIRSVATTSLSKFNITLAPLQKDGIKYWCWVDYDGQLRQINVYLTEKGRPKPTAPVLGAAVDLSAYLAESSYFGFSGSTGEKYQLNCILYWNLTIEILPLKTTQVALIWFLKLGVPVLTVLLVAVAVTGLLSKRKREKRDEGLELTLKWLPGTPREFQYRVLKKATGNFNEKNVLGRGGYGVVYKGIIPHENSCVAVKSFSRETMQGDFLAELTIINQLRHKNLVGLIGWCHKNGDLLLVYEFMLNGSLDRHLFNELPGQHLKWHKRRGILADLASALHYLHYEYNQRVVHRDLKASNVLLDENFNARLGDFGLARAIDNERTSYADIHVDGVPGTIGYLAPECLHTGKATRESDIFGFGAVVLEVVCGRHARCDIGRFKSLVDWVWSLYPQGRILDAVDPRLEEEYEKEEAARLLLLGLACSHPTPKDRPNIQAVVQIISGTGPLPEVPTVKPAFVWPSAFEELNQDNATIMPSSSITKSSSNPLLYVYSGHSEFRDVSAR